MKGYYPSPGFVNTRGLLVCENCNGFSCTKDCVAPIKANGSVECNIHCNNETNICSEVRKRCCGVFNQVGV